MSEIKNLRKFLEKCLNTTVLDYKLNNLTKSGDNYGSLLQSLEVTVADSDGCVSFTLPVNNVSNKL